MHVHANLYFSISHARGTNKSSKSKYTVGAEGPSQVIASDDSLAAGVALCTQIQVDVLSC